MGDVHGGTALTTDFEGFFNRAQKANRIAALIANVGLVQCIKLSRHFGQFDNFVRRRIG